MFSHLSHNQLSVTPGTVARQAPLHGVLQARMLEWVAVPFYRDLPDPGIEPMSLQSHALVGRFFTTSATWEAIDPVFSPSNQTIPYSPV